MVIITTLAQSKIKGDFGDPRYSVDFFAGHINISLSNYHTNKDIFCSCTRNIKMSNNT